MNVFEAALQKFGQPETCVNKSGVVGTEETTAEKSNDPQTKPCQESYKKRPLRSADLAASGVMKRGCGACPRYDDGWCYNRVKRTFYAIRLLKACPLEKKDGAQVYRDTST